MEEVVEESLAFKEEFYNALESAKNSFDSGLIHLIHLLQSGSVPEDQKQSKCDEIVEIGHEINAFFSSVKMNEITEYNIRDFEQRIIKKLEGSKTEISKFNLGIEKKYALHIDRKSVFSINDIVNRLSSSKIYGNYALTKDKLDSLLVIRRFIIGFYESLIGKSANRERQLDKDFFDLKQKTFLVSLRNDSNKNPDIFFLSISLIRKMIYENKRISIAEPGKDISNMDEVFIRIGGENDISIQHHVAGKKINCRISKIPKDDYCSYSISGGLEMGGGVIEFQIEEEVRRTAIESFEHVIGLDYIESQYDKAFLAYSKEYNDMKNRLEEHQRKKVVDAALNELFG
jgi:hypothetical protein